MAKLITLTNKSTRVFSTSEGNFHPGTSKEFEEKEAIQLLGYAGEIVRTIDALGANSKKVVEQEVKAQVAVKDKEIGNLKSFITKLTTEVELLKTQLKTAKSKGTKSTK